MVRLIEGTVRYLDGALVKCDGGADVGTGTMAYRILAAHDVTARGNGAAGEGGVHCGDAGVGSSVGAARSIVRGQALRIRFDALTSHDITYVGIVQTARGSGLTEFPVPYVLTNCHNSLCAVGGTINEDDHVFGLSAAQKYGGIFVPAHIAVIHQYMREVMAGGGRMILGSDSHTRYGALGTMAIGEGGPELVKQIVGKTYDIAAPDVVAVRLTGRVRPGVGPQDVALALIRAVFANGFVKNAVMEFVGDGILHLPMDYRNGIDVMTTETACLSSIWQTDEGVEKWLGVHGRAGDFARIAPNNGAVYSAGIEVDLGAVEPMIALPFHPSNAYTSREFLKSAEGILAGVDAEAAKLCRNHAPIMNKLRDGKVYADQGVIAGCAGGTFDNIVAAEGILAGGRGDVGIARNENIGVSPEKGPMALPLPLSVYPASQPILSAIMQNGVAGRLVEEGAVLRTAFCGPCFGAGDVPGNGELSIRHSTRNFPNREGAQPAAGQMAYVALMDARSIAATAACGGAITSAMEWLASGDISAENGVVFGDEERMSGCVQEDKSGNGAAEYVFNNASYAARVYNGLGAARPEVELKRGPNIVDWPSIPALPEHLTMEIASAIYDDVTTTDELIPSGETSSYRSNPMKLAEFTLSRRDPGYVARAKEIAAKGKEIKGNIEKIKGINEGNEGAAGTIGYGSCVFAIQPGDGSAREQAASCQRVLSGCANIASEYATRRYRANLINWGMLPFILDAARESGIAVGDTIFIQNLRIGIASGQEEFLARIDRADGTSGEIALRLPGLTRGEREIILAGCLMNYYAAR